MAREATAYAHLRPVPASQSPTRGAPVSLARIDLIPHLKAAEAPWRRLERESVLTPYQHFDWIEAWQRHVGAAAGIKPLIVVGFERADEPLFLLPLGKWRHGPFTVARFLGGKHANYNFGPWRADFRPDARTLRAVLEKLKAAGDLDALALVNQPRNWGGLRNPFESFAHQPSPSEGYRLALEAPGEALLNRRLGPGTSKRLRTKEHRLARLSGYRHVRASTPAEVERYLTAFFAQKSGRFAEQGIDNIFGRPEVEAFLREACLQGLAQGRPVIELHALDTDAEVLSVFGGVNDGRRFSSMFNSYTLSDHARQSPGMVLLMHLVADCADCGLAIFDLGVGKAGYKSSLCDEVELLFDSYLPLKPRGRIIAAALSGLARIKRTVKRSPALLELVYQLRRLRPQS